MCQCFCLRHPDRARARDYREGAVILSWPVVHDAVVDAVLAPLRSLDGAPEA